MEPTYKTEGQVRAAFWVGFPAHIRQRGKRQNEYTAIIRQEWCEFVDMLLRDGHITETLAQKVTL